MTAVEDTQEFVSFEAKCRAMFKCGYRSLPCLPVSPVTEVGILGSLGIDSEDDRA